MNKAIKQALESHEEITFDYLAKLAKFTDEEIKWAQVFWQPTFNKEMIYIYLHFLMYLYVGWQFNLFII